MKHQLLVYDKYSQRQWEVLSYREQQKVADEWMAYYPFNVKYWPLTAGEGCYP
jgi:hypothetical protein